jgi:protein SCO1
MYFRPVLTTIAMLACFCTPCSHAAGQMLSDELPTNAVGIDVEDKVGEFIPLDLIFKDERGNGLGLGKYFKKGKPVVLTLNYSDCPGLCIAQLDNLVDTLKAGSAKGLGDRYEIVTVSIDPTESHDKAAKTKQKYVGLLPDTKANEAWHFLTGKQSEIAALADAVGFRYSYDRLNKRYNHPAATYFVSEDGRICRYLLSLGVEPQQFDLAVAEAGEGKLTSSVADAIIQFCYMYDPEANRYSASARRMLAFAAAAFCLMLIGCTAPFWFSKRKSPAGSGAELQPQLVEIESDSAVVSKEAPSSEESHAVH